MLKYILAALTISTVISHDTRAEVVPPVQNVTWEDAKRTCSKRQAVLYPLELNWNVTASQDLARFNVKGTWTNVKSDLQVTWLNGSKADVTLLRFAGHCVVIDVNAVHAVDCESKRHFFCEEKETIDCASKQLSWHDAVKYCKDSNKKLIQSVQISKEKQRFCAGRSAGLWIGAKLTRTAFSYSLNAVSRESPEKLNIECPEDSSYQKVKCGLLKNVAGLTTCIQVPCFKRNPFLCDVPRKSYVGPETIPSIFPIEPVVAKENSSVTLFCNSTGNPAPESSDYGWSFKGLHLAHGTALKLKGVTRQHSGEYICSVAVKSRKTGRILSSSRATTVTVQYLHLRAHDGSITVNEGESFEVTCTADGVPSAIRFSPWTHTDRLTDKRQIGKAIDAHATSYSVAKAKYTDMGTYTCFAKNEVDKKQASTKITVLFPPKSDRKVDGTKMIYSTRFKDINLEIKVIAYPINVKFTWYRQNINSTRCYEISSMTGKYTITSNSLESSLKIVNATMTDFTNYSLKAENGVSKGSYFHFRVMRKGCPSRPDIESVSYEDTTFSVTWRGGNDGGHQQTLTLKLCYASNCQVVYSKKAQGNNKPTNTHIKALSDGKCYSLVLEAQNNYMSKRNGIGCKVETKWHRICTKAGGNIFKAVVEYRENKAMVQWQTPDAKKYDRQVIEQWEAGTTEGLHCNESSHCNQTEVPLVYKTFTANVQRENLYEFIIVFYDGNIAVSSFRAKDITNRGEKIGVPGVYIYGIGYLGFLASICTITIMVTAAIFVGEK